jgi:hypothetical protein
MWQQAQTHTAKFCKPYSLISLTFPGEQSWSGWQVLSETGGTIKRPRGRYVQIELELSTRDALQSPRLRRVMVAATPVRTEDWTLRLRVPEEHNEQIVRTSIPFRYEPMEGIPSWITLEYPDER